MCELLIGLPDVTVLGVIDHPGRPSEVHVESRTSRPDCVGCGQLGWKKDTDTVTLVDLPCFGRPTRLVWRKQRWSCPTTACAVLSWTAEERRIAPPRVAITDRAGCWVTEQVGRYGRTVNEIAGELGCGWHTINDAVISYGVALVDDPERIGTTTVARPGRDLVRTGRAVARAVVVDINRGCCRRPPARHRRGTICR